MTFGDFVYNKRIELGITLREFCEKTGLDPSVVSRVERMRCAPPSDINALKQFACGLDIMLKSKEWFNLMALAMSCSETYRPLSEKEAVKRLPLFFRGSGSFKADKKIISEMIEVLKNA